MKQEQWEIIRKCARCEAVNPPPVALIVDSPWIPGYLGLTTLDYLTVPEIWLQANLRVEREFPQVIFLPGFWVEMGMATEPSGFGGRVSFFGNQPPAMHPLLASIAEADRLTPPDPSHDGLMPVILNYYRRLEPQVQEAGQVIKMVAARGPLTVASHLLGVSEFLLGLKLDPRRTHALLRTTTTLTRTWLAAQAGALQEAEGILVLDDVAGFLSPKDYLEFAHPYLQEVFEAFPGVVKLFHNDTNNPVCYPHLRDLGIDIFNFTHGQPLARVRELAGPEVCLMGNVPPRDILANGTREQVADSARACLQSHPDGKGLLLSAGGGTSPGTPGDNIRALSKTG